MEAEIGIIGGSGFYSLLEGAESVEVDTKYGKPSSPISVGSIGGKSVAFISRHGLKPNLPPHKVPYRANIEAFSNLGVKRILTTSTVGSLSTDYKPGEFILFDQFMNATQGRPDTFYDEDKIVHVGMAYPYCNDLRETAAKVADSLGIKYHRSGTVVVINGPRFSTKAESIYFGKNGAHAINMTQYPEVALAREKGICYLGIGLVTDYDAGLEGRDDIKPVSMAEILKIFSGNVDKAKGMMKGIVPLIKAERNCECSKSLEGAAHG